jgi:hypothetical protein
MSVRLRSLTEHPGGADQPGRSWPPAWGVRTGSIEPLLGLGRCVLLVGDGFEPGGAVAVVGAFEHREVAHHAVDGGAVPVFFTGWGPDGVAGPHVDDGAIAVDDESGAVGAVQGCPRTCRGDPSLEPGGARASTQCLLPFPCDSVSDGESLCRGQAQWDTWWSSSKKTIPPTTTSGRCAPGVPTSPPTGRCSPTPR